MEIIIKGEPKEIADLVPPIQGRQGDSPGDYEELKSKLFRETYRMSRELDRVSCNEQFSREERFSVQSRYNALSEFLSKTGEDKLRAKAQFEAMYDFIIDSGLEQEYCDWRASLSEEAMDAA